MIYIYSSLVGKKSFAGKLSRMLGIRASKGPFRRGSVICWGRSDVPETRGPVRWLNHAPEVVGIIANKIKCFQALSDKGVRTVDWSTDRKQAQKWLDEGRSVYERHKLTGHSGAGIVLKMPKIEGAVVDEAPLYTRRVRGKFSEYRVHVVAGDIICIQQKRKMSDEKVAELGFELPDPEVRYRVRTYGNGWVFAVNDIEPLSADNQQLAIDAMTAVGAGSGCVDMAVTEDGIGHVIEINSAPALRSDTVAAAYAAKFADIIRAEERADNG